MSWKDKGPARFVMHFPLGILTVPCFAVWESLGVSVVFVFMAYELWQGWRINDRAWKDIAGFLGGLMAGGVLAAWWVPW